MAIRIKKVGRNEKISATGIHLFPPITEEMKLNAVEVARAKGFNTIWVHGKLRKVI